MKTPFRVILTAVSFAPLFLWSATSQPAIPSTPPENAPLRPVVPGAVEQPAPPAYELSAKWNDRTSDALTVSLKNDSDKVMMILGVQATRGVFVGDFPTKIAPKKSDAISFIYNAVDNTDGDSELIRVLTNQGIKDLPVKVTREAAVKFDTREVRWTAGGSAEVKTVTLVVMPGTAKPIKVRATGDNQATLVPVDATTWQIKITPASTVKSGQFAVFVEFDKPLPGKAGVILGVIQPKE